MGNLCCRCSDNMSGWSASTPGPQRVPWYNWCQFGGGLAVVEVTGQVHTRLSIWVSGRAVDNSRQGVCTWYHVAARTAGAVHEWQKMGCLDPRGEAGRQPRPINCELKFGISGAAAPEHTGPGVTATPDLDPDAGAPFDRRIGRTGAKENGASQVDTR